MLGRGEAGAVDFDRSFHVGGGEMRSKGEGQAEHRCELGPEQAGAEDPDGNLEPPARHRLHTLLRLDLAEITHELHDIARKGIDVGVEIAPQRMEVT